MLLTALPASLAVGVLLLDVLLVDRGGGGGGASLSYE